MTRIKKIVFILFVAFSLGHTLYSQETEYLQNCKGYTSWLPAPTADQSMLIGNGTMGAMVFGYPHNEIIILNHSALYLPLGLPKKPINQVSRLAEIRQLLLEGKGTEAAKIPVEQSLTEGYGGQQWSDPYIPAFDLKIEMSAANIEKYQRTLNFETGEAMVNWEQNGNKFQRKQFISRADSILVLEINATEEFDVKFTFDRRPVEWNQWDYINNNFKSTVFFAKDANLYYRSEFTHQWEGNIAGYEGIGKVLSSDGEISAQGNTVSVKNTKKVLLLVKIDSHLTGESFNTEQIESKLNSIHSDYATLLAAHHKIHAELFNRVNLKLNGSDYDKSLDAEVMMQEAKIRFSPTFVEKQFYAARYNILSATGTNPPNLQGIWGSSWTPPWSSDFTHDGNLPVAISSFLCSNMPELMMSFFNYHDARLNYYRDNAKNLYGCRGIQVPSHSSSHGWNVHFDPTWCLSFWNGGAAWTSHFYYDYWLYTNDKNFLITRAYPFMKEAALFYEDFLTLGENGKYVFNPSYSPENNPANNPSQATINATMDVMLAKELLRNLISAGKVLDENNNQLGKWEKMLSHMPDYEVDSTACMREWLWPGYQENHNHRHISHLYGMYDIIDIEIKADTILMNGVKNAVEERMKIRRNDKGGIMVFGMVQMAWVAANLGDADLVEDILSWLSAQYWSNSLATYHDPNGLFNMDLSGGFQTAVIRSLLYSEPGLIWVLPAKPKSWETGSISGILARNQIKVNSLAWNKDKITLKLKSVIAQQITLQVPTNTKNITINNTTDKVVKVLNNAAAIKLPAHQELTLIINLNN